MTAKVDFTADEWQIVLEAPPSAGFLVSAAERGGTFREAMSMAKAYVEARKQHGESELLDEIVSAKPELDHKRFHSPEELRDHCLQAVRDGVELVGRKAMPDELEQYRRFVVSLAERVAAAKKEGDEPVSGAERQAVDEVAAAAAGAQDT